MPPRKKQKPIPEQRTFLFKNPSRAEINKFEEVIDALMHSEAIKKYPSLSEMTKAAFQDPRERRQAILSRLDTNRGLFFKINKRIGDKTRLSPMERIEEILVMLWEYIRVGETERKLYGEVMTPIDLVEEMLDGLPKEVWSNPKLKWLDPANGCGVFPAVILKRLMIGLATWEPDEERRYKHIMEKMLHVCELQPKNMFIYLCAFDPKDKYALNIYTGSFLTEEFDQHSQEIWGVEQFDVIVGNPPYQTGKEDERKTQPIWQLFVKKKLKLIKKEGYLCTVHPAGWRNISGIFKETQKLLRDTKMLALKMNHFRRGQQLFGAAINFDFYCLQNVNNNGNLTKITCEDNTTEAVDISKMEFIPSENIKKIYALLANPEEEKVQVIHSFSAYETRKPYMSKNKEGDFSYPCIYTVKSPDKGNNQPTFFWSKTKANGLFGIPKVIWAQGASGVVIDQTGQWGLTQFGYAIVDDVANLENIKNALLSDDFTKNVMNFKHSLGDKFNHKIIALFRKDFWKEFV